jgi:hypothetical protein
MVLVAVKVLEVIKSMMIVIPGSNDNGRIYSAVEVLEAVKSWSNLAGDDPLEMMSGMDMRHFG